MVAYYSIGSSPSNSLQITGANCVPFHLLLYKEKSGQVYVCSRGVNAPYLLNGISRSDLQMLEAGDQLQIGSQIINWMPIFGITEGELREKAAKKEQHNAENKGMRIQLLLIYLAILVLICLLGFYI
jgi:hypothetical protein